MFSEEELPSLEKETNVPSQDLGLLTIPWTPSLKGRVLGPCKLIQDFVDSAASPPFWETAHTMWSSRVLKKEIKCSPEVWEAIWECVVSIWRLKRVEEEGSNDLVWCDHIEAWLVSS